MVSIFLDTLRDNDMIITNTCSPNQLTHRTTWTSSGFHFALSRTLNDTEADIYSYETLKHLELVHNRDKYTFYFYFSLFRY